MRIRNRLLLIIAAVAYGPVKHVTFGKSHWTYVLDVQRIDARPDDHVTALTSSRPSEIMQEIRMYWLRCHLPLATALVT